MKSLLLALCLFSCSKSDLQVPTPVVDERLQSTMGVYKAEIVQQQDSHGFIYADECDSLLFTSLAAIALDAVDIRAAREDNGRWHRRPAKDCYPEHSKSTISRDMLLGVMWYAYYHRDLELVESMWSYGSARSWIMGDGLRSRTLFTPALVSTLAQLIYKLGGASHEERKIPVLTWSPVDDFEAHLQVLHIMLRHRIYGTIEQTAEDRLKEQATRQPKNALFQYAIGNVSEAIEQLNDPNLFPWDRLPTSSDRCGRWLFERDYGKNWLPCSDNRIHSGGELLFLATLITKG